MGAAIALATAGCSNRGQDDSQEVLSALEATSDSVEVPAEAEDDPALRRSYGAAEMKLNECMKVQADGSIVGEQCPSAFVMFGPYMTTPSNADVRLTMEIEAIDGLSVSSDIVSSLAGKFHGSVEDVELKPKEKRRVAYKIHLFNAADGVEARLWVKGAGPSNFRISDFALEVK